MNPAATREEQAMACLEAAEQYRAPLLALATKLTGNAEEGMDLFQQTVLNCHDAIQRNGFAGERYQFYLLSSLRNQFNRSKRRGGREVQVDFQAIESTSSARNDEGPAPWAAKVRRQGVDLNRAPVPTPPADAHAHLAEQILAEAKQQFSYADRVLLRLHLDEVPTREIVQLTGYGEHTGIWRRLEKMKEHLRETFQQAWEALGEADY
jgi:DNA-directed RNA polymerase specialized sigma24 family protein